MKQQHPHIDHLIARYLAGEALPEEAMELDLWRSESQENEKYFSGAYTLYNGMVADQPVFNPQPAWQRLQGKLGSIDSPSANFNETKVIPLTRPIQFWMRVAAAILLLVGFAAVIVFLNRTNAVEVRYASVDTITSDTVFTGSVVTRNSNSTIDYHFDKKTNQEVIKLAGEAYFDLESPEDVTTLVEAGGLSIRDIGTAFHVSAYSESDTVRVWVDEGEVAMYTASNPGITLSAGEGGIYIKSTGVIETYTPPLLPNWHVAAREFHFNNATLWEVAEAFNAAFDMKLVVPNHLQFCRITVSFVNETPFSMASIIAETLGLTLEQVEGKLLITGYGCPE